MYQKKHYCVLLFLSLSSCARLSGMNLPTDKGKEIENQTAIVSSKPSHEIDIFSVKKNLQQDRKRLNTLRTCRLAIDPSQEYLVIGAKKGAVYQLSLDHMAPTMQNGGFKRLYQHQYACDAPIITFAPENKPFILASASNHEDTDSGEFHSNIRIYKEDGWSIEKTFIWPINAIEFNKNGTLLIMGGTSSINLFDLESGHVKSTTFSPGLLRQPLGDICLTTHTEGEQYIIAISEKGCIEIHRLDHKPQTGYEFHKYPEIYSRHSSAHIHCPDSDIIMTQSDAKGVNIMTVTDALLTMSKDQPRIIPSEEFIKTKYEQITFNTGYHLASAHWTKNDDASNEQLHTIQVFNQCSANAEAQLKKYILSFPQINTTYKVLECGLVKEHKEHLFNVAFHNNSIVGLSSCGKILIWKLPKEDFAQQENTDEETILQPSRYVARQRSKSEIRTTSASLLAETSFTSSFPEEKKGSKAAFLKALSGPSLTLRTSTSPKSSASQSTTPKEAQRKSTPSSRSLTPKGSPKKQDSPKYRMKTSSRSPREELPLASNSPQTTSPRKLDEK